MTDQEKLLSKYYKGETSLEEEKKLKNQFRQEEKESSEKDLFGYFESGNHVPSDLEDQLIEFIGLEKARTTTIRMKILRIASAAAVLILLASAFFTARYARNSRLENEFSVMEQALFQVSESLNQEPGNEMLVLWVDDDVEIIIN